MLDAVNVQRTVYTPYVPDPWMAEAATAVFKSARLREKRISGTNRDEAQRFPNTVSIAHW